MTRPSMERPTLDGFRRDRALGEGEQSAGDAADGAGDREGEPVNALHVDADGFGAQAASRARRASRSRTARTGSGAAAARPDAASATASRK